MATAPAAVASALGASSSYCAVSISLRCSASASARARVGVRASPGMATSTATAVVPAVIVGGGRVGRMLQDLGDGGDVLVGRGQPVPADLDGPILVCTRNDDLDAVLQATPPSRWTDLVFFQNGMMEPWFQSKGLGDADQVLAYFAVSKLGEAPVDGKTDTNPEGLTAAFGKWASAVAARLHAGGLSCKVLDKEAFQKQMLEKLIWISAFMLVGARHPGATVGAVEKEYRSEVASLIAELAAAAAAEKGLTFEEGIEERLCAYSRAVAHFPTAVKEVASLIAELAAAAAAEKGLTFEEGIEERLCAYSRAVAHFPTAVKEFKWRNGWFYSLTQKALAEGKPDPCPLHSAWLKELNVI